VGAKSIKLFAPHFNQHFGFSECPKIGGIQAFCSQFASERFTFTVLSGATRFNEKRGYTFLFQPFLQGFFNKF
jgi:hypothetical protein